MSEASRRGALGLLAAAALGGCGFRPLYGPGGGGEALAGQVALEGVGGRFGYHFRQAWRRRVGDPVEDPRFVLTATLRLESEGFAISPESDVTRVSLTGTADWTLRDRRQGSELRGEARTASGYGATGTPYATRIAAEDAERRVAGDLAERVFAQIAARVGAPPS